MCKRKSFKISGTWEVTLEVIFTLLCGCGLLCWQPCGTVSHRPAGLSHMWAEADAHPEPSETQTGESRKPPPCAGLSPLCVLGVDHVDESPLQK